MPENLSRYKDLSIYRDQVEREDEEQEPIIPIIEDIEGEIKLDEDEKNILKEPPKTRILEALSEEDFRVDLEMGFTKWRWQIKKDDKDAKEEEADEITEEEKELFNKIEAEARQPYDPIEEKINLNKRRVTDLKQN